MAASDETLAVPILRFPQWVDHISDVVAEFSNGGFDTVVVLPFDQRFINRLDLDETGWLNAVRKALSDVTDQILLLLGTFYEVRIEDRLAGHVKVITPKWEPAVLLGEHV